MTVASGPAALPRHNTHSPTATPVASGASPRRLADGVELVGEYRDSGFKVAPYIIRRADGQTVQVSQLLFLVAEACDGRRTDAQIAETVTEQFGRRVSADNVSQLADGRLRALGILVGPDGSTPRPVRQRQLLALNLRAGVIPPGVVNALTLVFRPLFLPPVILGVLGCLGVLDWWLFAVHGVAQPIRSVVETPVLLLPVLGLVIVSAALHECGHATGCRYGGARPGEMGVGLYVVWPAFYTDVTDTYRLGKGGRLRVDLGGVYFNVVSMLAMVGVFLLTGWEPLLAVVALLHIEVFHQFLPFLRLDGYYIVSDLVGVPDLFRRLKPTLLSLLPWRTTPREVDELKPWVRAAVTGWVLLTVPVLLWVYVQLIVNAPRMLATAWTSLTSQAGQGSSALSGGRPATAAYCVLQILLLSLPLVGLAYTLGKTFGRLGRSAWTGTAGRPVARTAVTGVAVAMLALLALAWRPGSPQYRPIAPGEHGTLQAGITETRAIVSGGATAAPADTQPAGAGAASTTTSASGAATSSQATSSQATSSQGASSQGTSSQATSSQATSSQTTAPRSVTTTAGTSSAAPSATSSATSAATTSAGSTRTP